jgi:DNA-binding HxlR family transcriptional regulator
MAQNALTICPACRLTHRGRRGRESGCPVARAAALLGDTWTLLLVHLLQAGPRRFGELQSVIKISPRVLSERLRKLQEAGLVTRRLYPEIPPRVEYALTPMGTAALKVVEALAEFGERWLPRPNTEALNPT